MRHRYRISFGEPHDDEEPFYVEAGSKEKVPDVFRREWAKAVERWRKNSCSQKSDYPTADELLENHEVTEVGKKELRHWPRPTCCKTVNKIPRYSSDDGPPVRLRAHDFTRGGGIKVRPHWRIEGAGIEIFHCPFCGSKLPEVELMENPTEPLWTNDDGYCGTCKERNMGCECNPPESAYRIVE